MAKLEKPKLYFVRHGETKLNADKCFRGWIEVPLDAVGIKEAEEVARKLKSKNISGPIYSSDLTRAMTTAEVIGKELNLPVKKNIALRPWDIGVFSGKKITPKSIEILHSYVSPEKIDEKVPEGESFKSFVSRFTGFVKTMANQAIEKNESYILVSHFRDLKLMHAWAKKGFGNTIDFKEMTKDNLKTGALDIFEPHKVLGKKSQAA